LTNYVCLQVRNISVLLLHDVLSRRSSYHRCRKCPPQLKFSGTPFWFLLPLSGYDCHESLLICGYSILTDLRPRSTVMSV
jgi:hypothetical protein